MERKFGVKCAQWKTPQVQMQLTCSGGLLGKKKEPIESAHHPVTHGIFICMKKSERWLMRVMAGSVNTRLDSTTLLEVLAQKMLASADHGDGPPCDEDDPMNLLGYDDPDECQRVAPDARSVAKGKRRAMNTIVEVSMPEVCPMAHVECDETIRKVKLWYRGKRSLWISQSDLEWALSYMRVEMDTCGVPPLQDQTDSPLESSIDDNKSPKKADPEVRWNFSRQAWEVTKPDENPVFFAPEDVEPQSCLADHTVLMDETLYEAKKRKAYEMALIMARS